MAYTALFDACVLYSSRLRELLLSLAETDMFRARWTEAINDEWVRNLKADRPDLVAEKIDRTRRVMNESVPDCLISEYEGLIPHLTQIYQEAYLSNLEKVDLPVSVVLLRTVISLI